jgi:hypothetical protein
MIADAPFNRILIAAQQAGASVDYVAQAGTAAAVTVRHARNRHPANEEKPCLTVWYVSDGPLPDDRNNDQWEALRELVFDAQADADLDAEDEGTDPTGMGLLGRMLDAFALSLKAEDTPTFLGGLVDWIYAGEFNPAERSSTDVGRMTRAFRVVYRVRSDDPNHLLSAGEVQ